MPDFGPMVNSAFDLVDGMVGGMDPSVRISSWTIGMYLAIDHPEWVQAWLNDIPKNLRNDSRAVARMIANTIRAESLS